MTPALALLIAALIRVESHGDNEAVGKTGELGCLQITQAVIDDVNTFQGAVHFLPQDRLNRDRSILICRLYLEHWCSSERLKRDADPRDYALVWRFGPDGYRNPYSVGAQNYWQKVRAELAAQGRRGTNRVEIETHRHE